MTIFSLTFYTQNMRLGYVDLLVDFYTDHSLAVVL